ncbi:MAG: tetratricopeptide repeat protein [Pseudomonadota bacterium]
MSKKYLAATVTALVLTFSGNAGANDMDAAMAAFDQRHYAAARPLLERLQDKRADEPQVLFRLAVSQFRTGDLAAAEGTLAELLDVAPDSADAHYLQGIIEITRLNEVSMFRKVGVARSAVAAWEQAVRLNPAHVPALYALFSFYANAPGFAGGDKDRAKELVTRIAQQRESYAELARAILALQQKQESQAISHFQRAVELEPEAAAPRFALAQHYMQVEDYPAAVQALKAFEAVPKQWDDPDQPTTLYFLGAAYKGAGDIAAARESLQAALSGEPNGRIRELAEKALKGLPDTT